MERQGDNINTSFSKKHNFLRVLPYISYSEESNGNFILLYTLISHFPWNIVTDDGKMIKDVSPYENNLWIMNTLIKWIDWMKENDVYDNTKIIIVSDHGAHWFRFNREIDIDIPFINTDSYRVPLKWMLDLNPVLLVKDLIQIIQ